MIEQKQVEIGGYTYIIEQFGARKGWKIGKKVAKVLLPVMSKFYGADSEDGVDFDALMEAVADNLDELDDQTIDELLSNVSVNKYKLDWDKHFVGRYGDMLYLLWEVISYNFQDVFSIAAGDTND